MLTLKDRLRYDSRDLSNLERLAPVHESHVILHVNITRIDNAFFRRASGRDVVMSLSTGVYVDWEFASVVDNC